MILMLVAAFLLGMFFKQMMGSVCSTVEGFSASECPARVSDIDDDGCDTFLDLYKNNMGNINKICNMDDMLHNMKTCWTLTTQQTNQ